MPKDLRPLTGEAFYDMINSDRAKIADQLYALCKFVQRTTGAPVVGVAFTEDDLRRFLSFSLIKQERAALNYWNIYAKPCGSAGRLLRNEFIDGFLDRCTGLKK